ncbi:hypothetical protein IAQ67_14305 [Paenibacillus peoriae]|uniref:Uncharacterized protein n=2 Tax=Paenibacillus peoriae TaxID=59893 RepID=A0A7H0YGF4_9BACL|nr:hypothetical protein IAQ67_14305 [Paenibacillus peoriae]
MVTPYSLMSAAQKKAYAFSDVSSKYNVYEKIISVEQLKLLPHDIRLRCWSAWQNRFVIEEILNAWCIDSIDELNSYLNEMNIPLLDIMETEINEDSRMRTELRNAIESVTETHNNKDENICLSLSDLVADDAEFFEFKLNGEMDTAAIVSELNQATQGIIGTQRKYLVNISVIEII